MPGLTRTGRSPSETPRIVPRDVGSTPTRLTPYQKWVQEECRAIERAARRIIRSGKAGEFIDSIRAR